MIIFRIFAMIRQYLCMGKLLYLKTIEDSQVRQYWWRSNYSRNIICNNRKMVHPFKKSVSSFSNRFDSKPIWVRRRTKLLWTQKRFRLLGKFQEYPKGLETNILCWPSLSINRAVGSFFMVVGLSKSVGHHGWPKPKNFKITLAKTPLNSPQKTKLGLENKWFKTSYLEFIY